MNIILISLFSSLILHGHVDVWFRRRKWIAKRNGRTMEVELMREIPTWIGRKFDGALSCVGCLSFWIACIIALIYVGDKSPIEALTQFDWQQVCATFIIASFYDKLIA